MRFIDSMEDLLRRTIDPSKRIIEEEALQHE